MFGVKAFKLKIFRHARQYSFTYLNHKRESVGIRQLMCLKCYFWENLQAHNKTFKHNILKIPSNSATFR